MINSVICYHLVSIGNEYTFSISISFSTHIIVGVVNHVSQHMNLYKVAYHLVSSGNNFFTNSNNADSRFIHLEILHIAVAINFYRIEFLYFNNILSK